MFITLKTTYFVVLMAQFASVSLSHPSPEKNIEKRFIPLDLGLAKTYGTVAATTLTSTGNTSITGDCGTCPGTAINGFPPGKCSGTTSAGETAACGAEAACLTAYNDARAAGPTVALPATDLGGLTLDPGVYTFPKSAGTLTGAVTLNGTLDSNGQFIFLLESTFKSAAASQIVLINGAQACNVYIIVGSSATVGTASELQGNIIAYTSVSRVLSFWMPSFQILPY
jgi:hypothetical protein